MIQCLHILKCFISYIVSVNNVKIFSFSFDIDLNMIMHHIRILRGKNISFSCIDSYSVYVVFKHYQ